MQPAPSPILGADMKKAPGQGGSQEVPMCLAEVRNRPHRNTIDRCLYREARQRFARHLAEHRSVTIGRTGARRSSPTHLEAAA